MRGAQGSPVSVLLGRTATATSPRVVAWLGLNERAGVGLAQGPRLAIALVPVDYGLATGSPGHR